MSSISKLSSSAAIVWSKNPIWYNLLYSGITPGNSIQVQVMDSFLGTPLGEPLRFTLHAAAGVLEVEDLQKIIDPYLEYNPPAQLDAVYSHYIWKDTAFSKTVHLRYREYSLSNTANPWIDDYANRFLVLKGGIGDMTFTGMRQVNNVFQQWVFFPNVDGHAHPWLSYRPVFGNVIHKQESGFLFYMHLNVAQPEFQYSVTYLDGSTALFRRDPVNTTPPFQNLCYRIPIGIKQAKLDPANKGVLKYTVSVTEPPALPMPLPWAFMEFTVDNQPVFDTITLYFRNSVGGIESIMLRGVTMRNGGRFTKRSFEAGYPFNGVKGARQNYSSLGTVQFSGNTAYLDKQGLARLYDLYNNTDFCGIIAGEQWIPVLIPEQEMLPVSSDNHLHSYKIDFETAGDFEMLPRQIFSKLIT